MRREITARTLGINFRKDGWAETLVWAPFATTVHLILDDKKEVLPLEKKERGYWFLSSNKIKPHDLYRFSLNHQKPLPDPASLSQPHGVHDASQAVDLHAFSWTDNDWKNLSLEEYILYELHTGTFTAEGTFSGLEQKLDYLIGLGITAIEIMPVAQFAGSRNWGYDGVFPFAVQHSYGGAVGLQKLVNACHKSGIAVVLDVVYNHIGPEGNYLGNYGPYFTDKYQTPWGGAINFDDAWCDEVRRYFIENVLMWFRDFHIDALRLDAVHAIKDFSPVPILKEIKEAVNELMKLTGRVHYLIAESDLNDNRLINSFKEGGYGMDAQWVDEFHHALRVTATGEQSGYYSDFNGIQHLAKSYTDAYVYDGQYSLHRKKTFGIKADRNAGKQFVVFSQNHDQVGNRMLGERTSRLVSFEMQKLLAGAVMVSPFLPMLFMGEEWGETNPFLYFVSHSDPQLAEAVRRGRKEEFAAFYAKGEAPDPMAEKTFLASKLQWHLSEMEPHRTMLLFYRELINLRKKHPVLKRLSRADLKVGVEAEKQTLILQRWHGSSHLICFQNYSKQTQQITAPASSNGFSLLLHSAHSKWGGSAAGKDILFEDQPLILPPESISIYANENE